MHKSKRYKRQRLQKHCLFYCKKSLVRPENVCTKKQHPDRMLFKLVFKISLPKISQCKSCHEEAVNSKSG